MHGPADSRRPSLRRRRSVPFRGRIRRADPRRTGPATVAGFRLALAGVGKSMVVANLALAIAEGGTRVLAVDADAGDGSLTARLLLGTPADDGLEQVLAGQQPLDDCIQPSPLNDAVAVLGPGPALPAAGDGRGPLESGVCVARYGEVQLRRRADRQPSLAAGRRRYRAGQRLRRCDHRPQPRRADPGPPRDG